jgi:RNA polymerase sigma-70 factor (ECF subfamily)
VSSDVRRGKAEDDPRFEALFRAEFEPLVRAMRLLCGDAPSAADAVQDAFLQAHRHWSRVSTLDDPSAWVRRAAINRVRNQLRGRARQLAALPRLAATDTVEPREADPQPELATALAALPKQQREAVVLYYLLDQPTRAIANALGVAEATVRSHLRHGRDQLQIQLGEATQ